MSTLEWSDELACGYEDFDNDHKHLLGLYNKLCVSLGKIDDDQIADMLEELISYTGWHFRHEERIMQEYEYPDYFEHKQVHDTLVSQAKDLYEQFMDGVEGIPEQLLPFLKNWLVEHIMGLDKKNGQFLSEQQ